MLKKRLGLIILAFVTMASSVACARVVTTSPDNSKPVVETTSPSTVPDNSKPIVKATIPANSQPSVEATVPANSEPTVDTKNEVSLNSSVESYFGTWIINKYVPTGRVEGFSKKNASAYLGEKIIVDKTQIVSSEGTIKSPVFVANTATDTEFFDHWNIHFKNAGITGTTVTEIKVTNFNIENGTEDRIGSNFIITADKKTYTFIGGALFELGK